MRTVAAVWDPDPERLAALADRGAVVHPALTDQGPYARGTPFAAFVVGDANLDPTSAGASVWAWLVDEHVPRQGPSHCAVAMVSLMRRRRGSTPDEFVAHWIERHAPLALRRHAGLADYHQFVVREELTPGVAEIDGIAQLGFLTRTDFETRFFDSDDGRAEIMADVARFMDRPGPETTLVAPTGDARRPR